MGTIYKVKAWDDYSSRPSKITTFYYKTEKSALNCISTLKSLYDLSNRNVIRREWGYEVLEDGGEVWNIHGYKNTCDNGGYTDGIIYIIELIPIDLLD